MRRRVSSSSLIVGAFVVGLGVAPNAPAAYHDRVSQSGRASAGTDLDSFSDAQLDRDLQDELDDVLEDHAPGDVADVATMQAEIIEALSDDGDTGAEAEITLADLRAEMEEAGTSVEEVVHDALERLDQASLDRPDTQRAVGHGPQAGSDKPSYGLAVRDSKRSLIREIRKVR